MFRRKYIFIMLICLSGLLAPRQVRAQIVNDPIHTAISVSNGATATADALSNFLALLDQLELAGEQAESLKAMKNKVTQWQENIEEARSFIEEINNFANLARMLQSQIQMIDMYSRMIKTSAGDNFNEYYLANLLNYTTSLGWAVDALMDTINTIINERGLTKAERKQEIDEATEKSIGLIKESNRMLIDELMFMNNVKEVVALENFFMGLPPETGLDCIGAETTGVAEDATPVPTEQAASESEVLSGGKQINNIVFDIILYIIGFSCLGSLAFAFARVASGQQGAETMFVRIFAVVIIVFIVFTIIHNMVFN